MFRLEFCDVFEFSISVMLRSLKSVWLLVAIAIPEANAYKYPLLYVDAGPNDARSYLPSGSFG